MVAGITVGTYFSPLNYCKIFEFFDFKMFYHASDVNNVGFWTSTRSYTSEQMSSAALHSHLPDSAGSDQYPLSDFDLLGKHKEATKFLHPELNLLECGAPLQLLLAHCRWGFILDHIIHSYI